jgi:metallo-beta-lactamase class B
MSQSGQLGNLSLYFSAMTWRLPRLLAPVLGALAMGATAVSAARAQAESDWRQPFEPVKIVGNVYYVGTRGLSSFLVVTPAGGILIDSGEEASVPFVRANVERLGFRLTEVKILLAGHAHFDHVGGHAAIKRLSGAQVVVMDADRDGLESGTDRSALGNGGWTPVHVDRVIKDGDTVALGGTTLRAVWAPGHTPGCTVWTTTVPDGGRNYSVAIFGCGAPNGGVKLIGNPKFPTLVDDAMGTIRKLKMLKPDIYVSGHPQMLFAGKIDRMKAGERPHPLLDPGSQAWTKMLDDAQAAFEKRVAQERGQSSK